MVTSLDVLALLDSLGTRYPGGVPRGGSVASSGVAKFPLNRVRCSGPQSALLVCVGFSAAESLLAGPTGALLEAALGKGLKLDPASVALVSLGEGATVAEVSPVLENLSAPIGVALGASVGELLGVGDSTGSWSERGGRAWRVTLDLGAVLADPALKRPLWNDLQAVGTRLSELNEER